jgi:hypothetical protein
MGRDQAGEVEEHIPALHEGHEEHDPWQEFYGEGGDEKVDASRGRLEGGPVVGQRQDQGRTEGHPAHDEGVEDEDYRADEEEEHDEIAFARETHALAVGGVFEDYARLAVCGKAKEKTYGRRDPSIRPMSGQRIVAIWRAVLNSPGSVNSVETTLPGAIAVVALGSRPSGGCRQSTSGSRGAKQNC